MRCSPATPPTENPKTTKNSSMRFSSKCSPAMPPTRKAKKKNERQLFKKLLLACETKNDLSKYEYYFYQLHDRWHNENKKELQALKYRWNNNQNPLFETGKEIIKLLDGLEGLQLTEDPKIVKSALKTSVANASLFYARSQIAPNYKILDTGRVFKHISAEMLNLIASHVCVKSHKNLTNIYLYQFPIRDARASLNKYEVTHAIKVANENMQDVLNQGKKRTVKTAYEAFLVWYREHKRKGTKLSYGRPLKIEEKYKDANKVTFWWDFGEASEGTFILEQPIITKTSKAFINGAARVKTKADMASAASQKGSVWGDSGKKFRDRKKVILKPEANHDYKFADNTIEIISIGTGVIDHYSENSTTFINFEQQGAVVYWWIQVGEGKTTDYYEKKESEAIKRINNQYIYYNNFGFFNLPSLPSPFSDDKIPEVINY